MRVREKRERPELAVIVCRLEHPSGPTVFESVTVGAVRVLIERELAESDGAEVIDGTFLVGRR